MAQPLQIRLGRFPLGIGVDRSISAESLQAIATAQAQLQAGRIREAFRLGGHGSRGGTQWAPLARRTVRARLRRGRTTVLIDSGRLRNTIFGAAKIEPGLFGPMLALTVTAPAPYAAHHQFGTRNMPARPPLEITAQDRQRILQSVRDQVHRMMNGG